MCTISEAVRGEEPSDAAENLLALKVSFKPAPLMGHSEAHLYPGDACDRARGAASINQSLQLACRCGVHRRPKLTSVAFKHDGLPFVLMNTAMAS